MLYFIICMCRTVFCEKVSFFFLVIFFFLGRRDFKGNLCYAYAAAAKRTDALHSLQKKEWHSLQKKNVEV